MASSTKIAAWCCSRAAAVLAALGWSTAASATNGATPVVPASFPASECLTTISRSTDPEQGFAIGIPFEDVGITQDEVPGSRHMQFFATCHDRDAAQTMPTWISRSDADAAAAVDPTVIPPTMPEVLEEAAAWSGGGHDGDGSPCTVPIVAADQRLAITCDATADGIRWDTTGVPAGAYVVWGYTYEGARSIWSRRPGIVRVVDDDPDTAPPAVAFSSPTASGEIGLESGLIVEGCAAGAAGSTLTLSWASYADLVDDPVAPWLPFAELEAGAFSVGFVPPEEALYAAVVFRAEVHDPQGRTFAAISSEYVAVVPGCSPPSGGKAGVADACGVAEIVHAPEPRAAVDCSAADGGSTDDDGGASSDGGESSDGSGMHDGSDADAEPTREPDAAGCRLGGDRGTGAWWSASLLLVCLARRRRASAALLLAVACSPEGGGTRADGGLGITAAPTQATDEDTGELGSGDEGTTGSKLDAGVGGSPGSGCDPDSAEMGGMTELSYIWIANSPEGTVSKIDTRTRVELARYYTGPSMADDPSRTSVNLRGDVAIANRNGGIVKLASELERCVDRNGNGTIETSSGPDEVLPWDDEECRLWHRDIAVDPGVATLDSANTQGPRPTAWDLGEHLDPCRDDHRVWVGWFSSAHQVMHMLRLDGKTGDILDVIESPWQSGLLPGYGPYGGAIDPDNAMWVIGLGGPLARVDPVTLEVQRWDTPSDTQPYGIAIDHEGDPWLAGLTGDVVHFDPDTASFDVIPATAAGLRGLQVDRSGVVWAAHGVPGGGLGCGLVAVDVATRTLIDGAIPLPGCVEPVGVSIDADGFVWLPDKGANGAFKVDPLSYATEFVGGLTSPYTYSDMTGSGLALVAFPPAG